MAASEAGRPNLALRARDLATDPEAPQWVAVCAWVPGTGHCRNRDCSDACLLRAQCEAAVFLGVGVVCLESGVEEVG